MQKDLAQQWADEGFIYVPSIFSKKEIDKLLSICNRIREQAFVLDPTTNAPANPNGHCFRHLNHPEYFKNNIEDYKIIMNTICDDRILSVVNTILNQKAIFRTTSYFYEPKDGIQDGNWHRDTQFGLKIESEEEKKILECAQLPSTGVQMQIALEPSEDVEFVPRSHKRWDTPEEYNIRLANNQANNCSNQMPNAMRFYQKPGDMIAFDPNGLHRGRYHSDKIRRTLMLTYSTSINFDYFTNQPWLLNKENIDILPQKTQAFFQLFIDAFKDNWKPQEVPAPGSLVTA